MCYIIGTLSLSLSLLEKYYTKNPFLIDWLISKLSIIKEIGRIVFKNDRTVFIRANFRQIRTPATTEAPGQFRSRFPVPGFDDFIHLCAEVFETKELCFLFQHVELFVALWNNQAVSSEKIQNVSAKK